MTATKDPLAAPFMRVATAAAKLPEVEQGTWAGTPALKVRGKSFARMKDRDTLVVLCPLDEKEILLEAAPDIYFETDHYKGWPAVLVRLSRIKASELTHRLERSWRVKAPKRLIKSFDENR
jgi:hypothetical protein